MTAKSKLPSIFVAACAASFSVSCSIASEPPSVEQALAEERSSAVPLGAFFQIDETIRAFGELIRSESADVYDIPKGATATRILYRSQDAAGRPTTASAVVIVPEGETPEGGWPLVVWAHGTTGVARQCGPSGSKYLEYYSAELMKEDFALLVVDYAGMSTEGPSHQYMARSTNALDIEGAVPAARAAVKSIGSRWLAIGHSQGGAAVWGLAEHKAKRPDTGYLGAIALAPAVGGATLVNNNASLKGETFYPLYWARAIKVQFPDFDVSSMLTENALSYYDDVTTKGCWEYGFARSADLAPGTVLVDGWDEQPAVQQFMNSIRSGDHPVAGPLFVAAGKGDVGVKVEYIESAVEKQCQSGGDVFFQVYSGNHDSMMETSYADQMRWMRDRFKGIPAKANCQ